jgi:electron transfer flavoprotein alpha subunit
MSGRIIVVGEAADGRPTRLATEVATLGRRLGETLDRPVVGLLVGSDAAAAGDGLAAYLPEVVTVEVPELADVVPAPRVAAETAAFVGPEDGPILVGASPDGRDVAGILAVLLDRPVLANAVALEPGPDGPVAVKVIFGGKLVARSRFVGPPGIVTVRPSSVDAEPASAPGRVAARAPAAAVEGPAVRRLERILETAGEVPLEEAPVVVVGGRGVGGPAGFALLEELAGLLGGTVGATRAAVDAGWIGYSRQIGQTGKVVKPRLYLGLGVSGAIQHKVGMQTAETIVAVNRDPDAPLAEYADLYVVGDLFEVGRALVAELRRRAGPSSA